MNRVGERPFVRPVLTALVAAWAVLSCLLVACQSNAGTTPPESSAGVAIVPGPTVSPSRQAGVDPRRSAWLAEQLRALVDAQHFEEVIDARTGSRVPAMPGVDTAVIELDSAGRPVAAAETLLDQAHPHGVAVPVSANLGATGVRWSHWSNTLWAEGQSSSDFFAGNPGAPIDFMAPYPASIFKLMVAFGVMRLVDQGQVDLNDAYYYQPGVTGCPGGGGAASHQVSWWLDAMVTYSDNHSACALLKLLHDRDAVDGLNATLQTLGLTTLQVQGTTDDGGGWAFDGLGMTALDTARLLLLFTDAPGTLWHTPTGLPVTNAVLSRPSRARIRGLLADQGLNQALSRSNWCGGSYPPAGIPQRVSARWIDPYTGVVDVHGRRFGGDIRSCNERAEVEFDHKTGLVPSAGGDAGVVTSLPGAAPRRYAVAVFTNLGCDFVDANAPAGGACRYTAKLATLGAGIDQLMKFSAGRATAALAGP